MQTLGDLVKDLTETGEFSPHKALADPKEAKVVRGEKYGLPVTDGIFPESKEFLLGYWIVDVAIPEHAYAIAGRISAAPGPEAFRPNMPIEVRQLKDSSAARATDRTLWRQTLNWVTGKERKRSLKNEIHSDDE